MMHNVQKLGYVVLGAFLGLLIFIGLRYVFFAAPKAVHFHANFAVFVEGKRLDLSGDKYMEPISGCKPEYIDILPQERAHMHEHEGDLIHIHDHGVTWGDFMANIGFAFGKTYLITDEEKPYFNSRGKTIKFILNGRQVENPSDQLIKDEDRLLVSYGSETVDQTIAQQFPQIASTAHEEDVTPDPASCSGDIPFDFWTKMKKVVWY